MVFLIMDLLSRIVGDAYNSPKYMGYKLKHNLARLADEEEACTKPKWAYMFAHYIPGADKEKCQESACKDPWYAYCFAKNIPGADIEKCRKVCEGTKYAF